MDGKAKGSDRVHASLSLLLSSSSLLLLLLLFSIKWGKISPPDQLNVVFLGLERAVLFISAQHGT